MYHKKVVRRICVRFLLIGAVSLMYYGSLYAATETLNPDAVGSEENLTSNPAGDNYLTVNDANDATFVHTAAAFTRDLYNLSTYAGSGTISQIEVFARATNQNGWPPAPTNNLKICIQPGATVYESGTITTTLNFTYTDYSCAWATNPDGGNWLWSDITDLQAGVSLKGAFMNSTRCAKVWVVITYTSDPPADPSGCSATDNHCADVVITWTDNSSDETAFYIYRDAVKVGEVGADIETYTDEPSAGTYDYYVKAYNTGGGTSGASNTNSGTRLATPDVPANCQATDNDHDKIVITWENVTGETGFKIYRDGGYLDFVLADVLTYTDNTAASGTSYSYQVTAYTTHTVPDPDVTCESAKSTADDGIRPTKYYVRKSGSNDSTGTTAAKAWLTISHAGSTMTIPGDIVYVGPGTYVEEVLIKKSGSATDLISYIADSAGTHTGDAAGTVLIDPESAAFDNGFLLAGTTVDYIKIDGFHITTAADGIRADTRTGIVISNNTIYNNIGQGIRADAAPNATISGNTIYDNTGQGIYGPGSNATISGNTIYDNADGIHCPGSNSIISGNSIYDNGGTGILHPGNTTTISNNSIYSNTQTGISANNATNLTIKNNLIYFHDGGGGGIDLPGNGSTISNNTIYHNKPVGSSADHDGIHVLTTADITVTITNNIITSNTRGIVRGTGENYTLNISYNLLYDNTINNYVNCSAGTGDISADPKFVSLSKALDLHIKSDGTSCHGGVWGANPTAPADMNWQIDNSVGDPVCSPCVDNGKPTDSYSNEPNVPDGANGGRINMGCFGNTNQASKKCGVSAVELVSFDARPELDYVILNWVTEAEIDNDKWLIKRAENKDADYKQIIKLHAQGVPNSYIYIDSFITPGRTYWYKLGDVDKCGKTTWHGPVLAKAGQKIKFSFFLKEPAANPSTGKVRLEYSVSGYQGDNQRPVTLKIYSISGQVVKTLVNERQSPGHYTIWWDGKNNRSKKVGSGTYFCHFKANGESVRKLIRIK